MPTMTLVCAGLYEELWKGCFVTTGCRYPTKNLGELFYIQCELDARCVIPIAFENVRVSAALAHPDHLLLVGSRASLACCLPTSPMETGIDTQQGFKTLV
ncbi:hypothetical protein ACH42_10100 [Endozoicomonas sp. (ex Bugula neritina AB1)]|nr:hypothetical protein ACH42_10100 [Endozoicomonas sp. (ex Bugula neritina AB1)]